MAARSRSSSPRTSPSTKQPAFRLNEGQVAAEPLFVDPLLRHICLVGGSRSGKTFYIVRAIMTRALRAADSRHAILRFRANAARQSIWNDTLPAVNKVCFPNHRFEEHRMDGYWQGPNGSQIWVGGLDDRERVEKILGNEYCVDPDARILTADLRWVRARDVKVGQELIGFPENLDGQCKLIPSVVERADVIEAERFLVVTDKGATIVSAQHKFVAHHDDRRHRNARQFSWRMAQDLKVGDQIRFATRPWATGETKEDGWFAGILDGEGWCSDKSRNAGLAQREGVVLQAAREWLARNGVDYREHATKPSHDGLRPCHQLLACGMWEAMRMLGIARPKRLNPRVLWEDVRAFRNTGHDATIIDIRPLGRGLVISFGTSTKTLIADGFLGHNCTIFLNECSQISYSSALIVRTRLAQVIPGLVQRLYYDLNPVGKSHWTNQLFGLKKDPDSTQPLAKPEQFARLFLNPEQNKENLSEAYLDELRNSPDRHRRRFYEGVYVDEIEGALWTSAQIETIRCDEADVPELLQIVVSVDPSGASTPNKEDIDVRPLNDEIGIVVAGLGIDQRVYLLADLSFVGGPEEWGAAAVAAYHRFKADHIIAESNFGGDMVAYVIRSIDGGVPVKLVHASQGKHVRAEPIANLYTRKNPRGQFDPAVRHVGRFPKLEEQLCDFTTLGYGGPKSPDRADAWIWAVDDLALQGGASGWLEYYRRLNEAAGNHTPKPEHGYAITPANPDRPIQLRVPDGISTVYLIDGTSLLVPDDHIIGVSEADAAALGARGWERLE